MRWPSSLLASVAIHLLGGFVLLLSWPKAEVPSSRISTYVVFAKDNGTQTTQVDQKGKGTGSGTRSRRIHRTASHHPPLAHNGLLAAKGNADLMPKPDFFAKRLEPKPNEPALREPKHDDYGWTSEIKRDGKVEFTDKSIGPLPDITELVMRLRGDHLRDPQKRKYLKDTKKIREARAQAFTRENLTQSLNDIGDRLGALWFDEQLSVIEKRQHLFEMWEECAEEGSEAVLAMSQIVRASIESFIKRNLPKGSELAYTDDDLSRLNQNIKSKAEFNPYG